MSRFWQLLVQQDIYGHAIGLHYKGADSYRTRVGAIVTIITYAFALFYLVQRITEFNDKSTQVENVNTVMTDMFDDPPHLLEDESFNFLLASNITIPENIGKWKASQKFSLPESPLAYITEDLALTNCSHLYDESLDYWGKRIGEQGLTYFYDGITKCLVPGTGTV